LVRNGREALKQLEWICEYSQIAAETIVRGPLTPTILPQ
jgi:hypothetical protein